MVPVFLAHPVDIVVTTFFNVFSPFQKYSPVSTEASAVRKLFGDWENRWEG